MSSTRLKTVLASLMVIGGLGSVGVSGTYALMNSEQTNAGSSFSSGTLTFGNTVDTGTTCFSYGAGSSLDVNGSCAALFSSATQYYPGTQATVKVTIADNGSLDMSDLSVYMPSCVVQTTSGAPAPGGADPCAGGDELVIQETDSAGNPTFCWYPDDTAGSCGWYDDSLSWFAQGLTTFQSALDLGSGPARGQSRYFTIGMALPADAADALQGEAALYSLTWRGTT